MKFLAFLAALAASVTANAVVPRATPVGNASLTIIRPYYLETIGAPGEQFTINLREEHVGDGFHSKDISVVVGINPCGDDDICGDDPENFWGDIVYEGKIPLGGDLNVKATVPEGFLDGRADLHVYHVAVTSGENVSTKLFTELKHVTVVVAP